MHTYIHISRDARAKHTHTHTHTHAHTHTEGSQTLEWDLEGETDEYQ